jgi:hypothetical protein
MHLSRRWTRAGFHSISSSPTPSSTAIRGRIPPSSVRRPTAHIASVKYDTSSSTSLSEPGPLKRKSSNCRIAKPILLPRSSRKKPGPRRALQPRTWSGYSRGSRGDSRASRGTSDDSTVVGQTERQTSRRRGSYRRSKHRRDPTTRAQAKSRRFATCG